MGVTKQQGVSVKKNLKNGEPHLKYFENIIYCMYNEVSVNGIITVLNMSSVHILL